MNVYINIDNACILYTLFSKSSAVNMRNVTEQRNVLYALCDIINQKYCTEQHVNVLKMILNTCAGLTHAHTGCPTAELPIGMLSPKVMKIFKLCVFFNKTQKKREQKLSHIGSKFNVLVKRLKNTTSLFYYFRKMSK